MHKKPKSFVEQLAETAVVARAALKGAGTRISSYFLATTALICLAAAGFTVNRTVGLVATALCLLLLDWHIGREGKTR